MVFIIPTLKHLLHRFTFFYLTTTKEFSIFQVYGLEKYINYKYTNTISKSVTIAFHESVRPSWRLGQVFSFNIPAGNFFYETDSRFYKII